MICVYDKHTPQDGFDNCGIAILKPLTAYITEELNGRYDYEITAFCDPSDDSWQHIAPYNMIKSSSTGQIFMIKKVTYSAESGYPTVKAWADHIWYYLADMLVRECGDFRALHWTLEDLFTERIGDTGTTYFSHGAGLTDYTFSHTTDFPYNDDFREYHYKSVSLAYALLGAPDSVVNLWKAELHRDNFNFSINHRKQGTEDNMFELQYGVNCSNISSTIDYTNRITEIKPRENFGHEWGISIVPDAGTFPHQVFAGPQFSYESYNQDQFHRDSQDYFGRYWQPETSYEVTFIDRHGTDHSNGSITLDRIKVGNKGHITDVIGNRNETKIISTKINDITHRVENVKLGQFINSQLHPDKFDKLLQTDDSASRRLRRLEDAINS